jgi:hypothetical protein
MPNRTSAMQLFKTLKKTSLPAMKDSALTAWRNTTESELELDVYEKATGIRSKSATPNMILGISPNATQQEIRQAWRKKALQWHPDKNHNDPQAGQVFALINWAYDKLRR